MRDAPRARYSTKRGSAANRTVSGPRSQRPETEPRLAVDAQSDLPASPQPLRLRDWQTAELFGRCRSRSGSLIKSGAKGKEAALRIVLPWSMVSATRCIFAGFHLTEAPLRSPRCRPIACATIVVSILALQGRPALAQTTTPFGSIREALQEAASVLGSGQTASSVVALTSIEVATAPLGTSTGGFTFTFDPLLRLYKRSASSFGPAFAQRSLTAGRNKVSLGANWLRTSYDSLGGFNLSGDELRPARSISAPALARVSSTALNLDLKTDTFVGFAQIGVTDSLDVGVIVPWVTVDLSAEGKYLGSSGSVEGSLTIPRTTASGLGDIGIFGKYLLLRQEQGGLAAAFDVRLPTGDRDALRGLDILRTNVSAVWSAKKGRVSPHANAGFEFWSRSVPISASGDVALRHQVRYAVGVELDAHPQLTLLVDLIGRQLRGGGTLGYQTFTTAAGSVDALVAQGTPLNAISIAPGAKWNVWRNLLVTASVLTSLSNDGLRAKVIPVAGLDWGF
jgi:hypothetical protein